MAYIVVKKPVVQLEGVENLDGLDTGLLRSHRQQVWEQWIETQTNLFELIIQSLVVVDKDLFAAC